MVRQSSRIGDALTAKTVLITGAGRGIGAAVARDVAAAGASVVVCDVDAAAAGDTARHISAAGGTAVARAADVADWDAIDALIEDVVAQFGSLDGLVNNAGRFAMALMHDSTPQMWADLLATNVLGVAVCGQLAARTMMAQGSGSIVNVTSGAHAGMRGMSVYGATKGAVASLTYTWALELAPHGVRVNALSPMAETRMLEVNRQFRRQHDAGGELPLQPPPAANTPVVSYLLSDFSAGVTGQVVRINGGDLALGAHPAVLVPVLHRDAWTLEAVREAFDRHLRDRQFPAGLTGISEPRYVAPEGDGWRTAASAFDVAGVRCR